MWGGRERFLPLQIVGFFAVNVLNLEMLYCLWSSGRYGVLCDYAASPYVLVSYMREKWGGGIVICLYMIPDS